MSVGCVGRNYFQFQCRFLDKLWNTIVYTMESQTDQRIQYGKATQKTLRAANRKTYTRAT